MNNTAFSKEIWYLQADFEAAEKLLEASLFAEMKRLAKPDGLSRYHLYIYSLHLLLLFICILMHKEMLCREQLRKSLTIVLGFFPTLLEFAPLPIGDLVRWMGFGQHRLRNYTMILSEWIVILLCTQNQIFLHSSGKRTWWSLNSIQAPTHPMNSNGLPPPLQHPTQAYRQLAG